MFRDHGIDAADWLGALPKIADRRPPCSRATLTDRQAAVLRDIERDSRMFKRGSLPDLIARLRNESRTQAQRPSTWIDEDSVESVGIGDSHIDEDPWPDRHGVSRRTIRARPGRQADRDGSRS
jgi:hypothetical protein